MADGPDGRGGYQRSHLRPRFEAASDADVAGLLAEFGEEPALDGSVEEEAVGADARLARRSEFARDGRVHRSVYVGVLEHDEGGVAAQLLFARGRGAGAGGYRLDVRRRSRCELCELRRRTKSTDRRRARVLTEGQPLHRTAAHFHQVLTDRRRSGEADLLDDRIGAELLAYLRSGLPIGDPTCDSKREIEN